jgi:hypothetical protein
LHTWLLLQNRLVASHYWLLHSYCCTADAHLTVARQAAARLVAAARLLLHRLLLHDWLLLHRLAAARSHCCTTGCTPSCCTIWLHGWLHTHSPLHDKLPHGWLPSDRCID